MIVKVSEEVFQLGLSTSCSVSKVTLSTLATCVHPDFLSVIHSDDITENVGGYLQQHMDKHSVLLCVCVCVWKRERETSALIMLVSRTEQVPDQNPDWLQELFPVWTPHLHLGISCGVGTLRLHQPIDQILIE